MVSAAHMRKLALSLPEVEEKSHFEQPDFRVRGKIFAGMSPDGALGTLKLTPELQRAVIDTHPRAFFPAAGRWGDQGWTRVHLAQVELSSLAELLTEAWRLTAPKPLAARFDGAPTAQVRKQGKSKRARAPRAGAKKPPRTNRAAKTRPRAKK